MAKICPICGRTYADDSVFCPTDGSTLRGEESSHDLVGSVIADRYLISKQLGEGGMGRVYLARHVRLPQQAAIKVMHPQMVKDQEAVARFNREAANAARIEHDRVARVFDFGETHEGLVYLAMEFVPGVTLRSLLAEQKRLPPVRAANITYQVAEGLDAAHRITIVHRDLKPDNIMVVTDEQGVDRCKVVDFGIAKAGDSSGGAQTQLTRTGVLVGTPEFMSPEQVVGEPLDARSDVYALALVAYQMFTGVLPFTATTTERSLAARLIDDPSPLSVAAPDVAWPADLQAAFDRALDKEPSTRTASALEFAEAVVMAVEGWMGTQVLRGRTPMSTATLPTPSASLTPTSSATAPAMPQVAAPSVAAGGTASVATAPSGAGGPAKGGGRSRTAVMATVAVLVLAGVVWGVFLRDGGAGGAAETEDKSKIPVSVIASQPDNSAREGTGAPAPATSVPKPRVGENAGAPPRPPERLADSVAVAPRPNAVNTAAEGTGAPTGAATAAAAKHELDSLQRFILADETGPDEARATIPVLQRLLKRLGSASDSAWAYLTLVSALGQAGDTQGACVPLGNARRLARTDAQVRAVNQAAAQLTCQ